MKISRRRLSVLLIVAAPLLAFSYSTKSNAVPAASPAGSSSQYLAFIGTYTNKTQSKGIYSFRYDSAKGQLTSMTLAAETPDPSWVAISENGKFLYAVNELSTFDGKPSGAITSFAVDRQSGKLTKLNQVLSGGADPCYISFDRTGKFLFVANYTGGSVASFPIAADGRLGPASSFVQHKGTGPNKERQEGPHAHFIAASADNHFVFAVDLGLDEVLVYRFDPATGALTPSNPPFAKVAPGAGPRHLAFTPDLKFAYVLSEVNSTVTAFSFSPKDATFTSLQAVSTIPKNFTAQNDTAEIAVHPSGKFLYASNRGRDSIAVFAVDPSKGTLTPTGDFPTTGKTPRSFALDPSGNFLLAANQDSNNIVIFRVDQSTGALTPTGHTVSVPAPVDISFLSVE